MPDDGVGNNCINEPSQRTGIDPVCRTKDAISSPGEPFDQEEPENEGKALVQQNLFRQKEDLSRMRQVIRNKNVIQVNKRVRNGV